MDWLNFLLSVLIACRTYSTGNTHPQMDTLIKVVMTLLWFDKLKKVNEMILQERHVMQCHWKSKGHSLLKVFDSKVHLDKKITFRHICMVIFRIVTFFRFQKWKVTLEMTSLGSKHTYTHTHACTHAHTHNTHTLSLMHIHLSVQKQGEQCKRSSKCSAVLRDCTHPAGHPYFPWRVTTELLLHFISLLLLYKHT